MAKSSEQPDKNESIELALSTRSQIYAGMVKEALEEEGIPALLKSTMGVYARGMLPMNQDFFNFRLYVTKDHLQRALEIVESIVPDQEVL